jgi:hypothetical protein
MAEYYTPPPLENQPTPPNSTKAIVSLVSGIIGIFLIPFIGSIVAVVSGHMAKREIRDSAGTLGGDGLATAGLILGYAGLVLWICIICLVVAFFGSFAMISESIYSVFDEIERQLILP